MPGPVPGSSLIPFFWMVLLVTDTVVQVWRVQPQYLETRDFTDNREL